MPLGDGLGLHPGLPGLKGLWDDGRLAIVRGVSYPKPDHSHFRSMDIWQTASPDRPVSSGWLGRWLDASGRDPLLAVSMDPVLPPMLAGETIAGAALPVDRLNLPGGALGSAFAALGNPSAGPAVGGPAVGGPTGPLAAVPTGPLAAAARAVTDLHRAATTLGPALDTARVHTAGAVRVRKGGGKGGAKGEGALAAQLDTVARCVEIGAPTRAYSVSLGGFDTHAGERDTQQRLLSEVDDAVTTFLAGMAGSSGGRNVVLVAYSEFGRRVAANSNQGTDHGTAGPVLVAGASVRGGFVGEQPSLTDLDNGDLRPTGDFRDVYATLLADVLNTDPERVLGPGRTVLPLIAT